MSHKRGSKFVGWGIIWTLVILGVMVTLWDYRQWTRAEMAKYGQGWGDIDNPAMELTNMYQDKELGIRMRLPTEWNREMVKISVRPEVESLMDLTDRRVDELKTNGNIVSERAYIAGKKVDWTVLTWSEEFPGGKANKRQEAWSKTGDRVMVISVEIEEEKWGEIRKTMEEIYKNIEMI
ncbi:hypothetical protein A2397_01545 [Candidatus Amesbacteria bacterium RIFOXYB1_FULL_44_23]|uniref:Uncharacterized protein n=1 Tax=Candidatus Amesbacteria bacterium RIFOXYB1_FULL_44_23 TaxID=1797263 RepID=A0A1F4ZRV9_9BACT|nr:MAG: hypothetical protein A2397_01545 [Candidatus Amesbacteria bacterium RIFOXYB1_FULL_44_23]